MDSFAHSRVLSRLYTLNLNRVASSRRQGKAKVVASERAHSRAVGMTPHEPPRLPPPWFDREATTSKMSTVGSTPGGTKIVVAKLGPFDRVPDCSTVHLVQVTGIVTRRPTLSAVTSSSDNPRSLEHEAHEARACDLEPRTMTTVHAPTGPPKVRAAKSWDKLRRKPTWSQPSSPTEKDAATAGPPSGGKTSPDENTRGRSSNELARDDVSDAMAKLKVSLSNNKAAAGKTRAGKSSSPTGSAPGSSEKKKDAETKQRPPDGESERTSASSSPSPSASSPTARDAGGETTADGLDRGAAFEWLLQRQIEVEMTLREKKVSSPKDLERVRETFATMNALFLDLHAAAAELTAANKKQCSVAALFQELLHKIAGVNAGLGALEGQRGDGNVPMHQAKVLDRRHRTGEECGDVNLVLGPERVREMVLAVRNLRSALRIKVEDANDVRMAEEAVKAGHSFWTKLSAHASQHGAADYAALETLRNA